MKKFLLLLMTLLTSCNSPAQHRQEKRYAKVAPSVVIILEDSLMRGTGFFFDSSLVATCDHVPTDGCIMIVTLLKDTVEAFVIARDSANDVCILETTIKVPPLSLYMRNPIIGQYVYSIGHPYGVPYIYTEGSIAVPLNNKIILNLPTYYGASGSPVLDEKTNKVLGIICEFIEDTGISFSVKIEKLRELKKRPP